MFDDLLGKLGDMKGKMDEAKEKLSNVSVSGKSGGNEVQVIADGNKLVKDIIINVDINEIDKEELQELLIIATNRAIDEADKIFASEMAGSAKDILPPGFGL